MKERIIMQVQLQSKFKVVNPSFDQNIPLELNLLNNGSSVFIIHLTT